MILYYMTDITHLRLIINTQKIQPEVNNTVAHDMLESNEHIPVIVLSDVLNFDTPINNIQPEVAIAIKVNNKRAYTKGVNNKHLYYCTQEIELDAGYKKIYRGDLTTDFIYSRFYRA